MPTELLDMHIQHRTVYRAPGKYAGWPANYGIWHWGDEIVTGFTLGDHNNDGGFHARDREQPFVTMQARSLDGGMTWNSSIAPLIAPGNMGISTDEHRSESQGPVASLSNPPVQHQGGIDFTHPDFALLCARTGLRAGADSWFYTSIDKCASWNGPFALPMFNQLGIAARTDYIVDQSEAATFFLTATKTDGEEGRVFCARTSDGGQTFQFISWLRQNPDGFDIMPASLQLEDGGIITAIRSRDSSGHNDSINMMRSEDNGQSWATISTPAPRTGNGGNPPSMIRLADGRICLTYGYRDDPYGIHAVLSEDNGSSWTDPLIIRDNGGNHDIGYPRCIQRADGQVVTIYYYNDSPEGERYIAATIWKP